MVSLEHHQIKIIRDTSTRMVGFFLAMLVYRRVKMLNKEIIPQSLAIAGNSRLTSSTAQNLTSTSTNGIILTCDPLNTGVISDV